MAERASRTPLAAGVLDVAAAGAMVGQKPGVERVESVSVSEPAVQEPTGLQQGTSVRHSSPVS